MSGKAGIAAAVLILAGASLPAHAEEQATFNRCWGAATQAAIMDLGGASFGEHASGQTTPRVGLANLARDLHDTGIIREGHPGSGGMGYLGAFVAEAWGLEVEECELP